MAPLPAALADPLQELSRSYLVDAITRGEYVGWLATPEDQEDTIVAGAGAQLRRVLPHPVELADGRKAVADGRHAIVLNVFTEPGWRRRGVAEILVRRILAWAREERLDRLILHASAAGRSLYERLGFAATNGMRFAGDLSSASGELHPG